MTNPISVQKTFNIACFSAIATALFFIISGWLPTFMKTINGEIDYFNPYFMFLYAVDKLFYTFFAIFVTCIILLLTTLLANKVGNSK